MFEWVIWPNHSQTNLRKTFYLYFVATKQLSTTFPILKLVLTADKVRQFYMKQTPPTSDPNFDKI